MFSWDNRKGVEKMELTSYEKAKEIYKKLLSEQSRGVIYYLRKMASDGKFTCDLIGKLAEELEMKDK